MSLLGLLDCFAKASETYQEGNAVTKAHLLACQLARSKKGDLNVPTGLKNLYTKLPKLQVIGSVLLTSLLHYCTTLKYVCFQTAES